MNPHRAPLSRLLRASLLTLIAAASAHAAVEFPRVPQAEWQPFASQVRRLIEATEYLGSPFNPADLANLSKALATSGDPTQFALIQDTLDRYCLYGVHINPEMRVKVSQGPAAPTLMENGWRLFLVKVHNEAGTTSALKAESPNAASMHNSPQAELSNRWLDVQLHDAQPMTRTLTGLNLEYRILHLYSRDAGRREARMSFNVGQGTQDIGFRNEVDILFTCQPSQKITLHVLDENRKPTTAAFEFRDQLGRVYPSQAKRYAPDFAFHPQVYRAHGETISLPEGKYQVKFSRGPESIERTVPLEVRPGMASQLFQVERWIDPSLTGWWSGDHHIHAAGCAHYTNPTEGVHAPDMARHCVGEDLKIGANLTWGPCFDYQKQFFTGLDDKASNYPYLLHYDIEVSGFGSHRSGHLCLLRLKEQMYPGGTSSDHWPTLCLNTLRWAKKQGALAGPAHSGWGLQVKSANLPNYEVPPFDGIGANEYIVDVTHEVPGPDGRPVPAVDFISTVDTPYVWELNIWYHTLNVGFRTRISGETDFPCIYGERVGLGRSYVKLDGKLDYMDWCEGIRAGRNYVGDGRSHLMDFKVENVSMGEQGSELKLNRAGNVRVSVKAAAFLDPKPNLAIKNRPYDQKPYWHIERARAGESRRVPVEVIVNGVPVARKEIEADGKQNDLGFDVPVEYSSWIAVRILPSSHTNPIFVLVDGKPIRASRRSAEWCLQGVENCWKQKEKLIATAELNDARAAYSHARTVYQTLIQESRPDQSR